MARKRGHGGGTVVFDDRRGRWVGRVPSNIDPKRPTVVARTKRECEAKLRQRIRQVEEGRGPGSRARLGDFLDDWLRSTVRARVRAKTIAPRTAAGYESHVRLYLEPHLGNVRLIDLTPSRVERFLTALQADQGLSPSTALRVRATLSKALTDAMRADLIGRNVAQIATPPRVERRGPSVFDEAELRRIVTTCRDHRLGAAFLLVLYTGLRASELCGLRWADLDLGRGTLRVRSASHRLTKASRHVVGQEGLVDGRPKTEASANEVPLHPSAVGLLRTHLATQRSDPEVGTAEDDRIFTTTTGTPLDSTALAHEFGRLLRSAGVAEGTSDGRPRKLHELRRTFATRLRDAGVPLEDVQRLGRWASPQVLLAHYAATPDDRLRRSVEALEVPGVDDLG